MESHISRRVPRALAVWVLLAGALGSCPVRADCQDQCPACTTETVPATGISVTDCSARDVCLARCAAEQAVTGLRSKALARLDQDSQQARAQVQQGINAQQGDLATRVATAQAAFASAVESLAAQARSHVASRTAAARQALAALPDGLARAASCLGSPLPKAVGETYAGVAASGQEWLSAANAAEANLSGQLGHTVQDAETAEAGRLAQLAEPLQALEGPSGPLQKISQHADDLRTEVEASVDSATLTGWAEQGFPGFDSLVQQGSQASSGAGDAARSALQSLESQQGTRIAGTGAELDRLLAQQAAANLPEALQDRVPALEGLGRSLWRDPSWPRVWTCVCRNVDLLPDPRRPDPRVHYASTLQLLTDATCTLASAVEHDRKVRQAFEQVSATFALPAHAPAPEPSPQPIKPLHPAGQAGAGGGLLPARLEWSSNDLALVVDPLVNVPLDTGFRPAAASSPSVRAALLQKAQDYATWTRAVHVTQDGLAVRCARTENRPHAPPLRACEHFHTLANAGQDTAKLLAARVFQFGQVADQLPPAARAAALAELKQSLAAVYAILTMAGLQACPPGAGVQDHCGTILRRDGTPSPASIHPVRGLPVRGFVRIASCDLAHCDAVQARPDSGWARFFRDDDALSLAGPDDRGPDGRPGPQDHNHRFVGCLHQIGCGVFLFEERGSGDDTFATLLAIAATYELFKARNVEADWRERLVTAAEDFGGLYHQGGLWLTHLNGDPLEMDPHRQTIPQRVEADQDPAMLLQKLSWLKTIIFMSADHRGGPDRAADLVKDYQALAGELFMPATATSALQALFITPESRLLARVLTRYFVQPFSVEYPATSLYLLTRYETDPVLVTRYRDLYANLVVPLSTHVHLPLYDYFMLHALRNHAAFTQSTGLTWDLAKDVVAAVMAQHRDPPEPFGNPAAGTAGPADEAFYATDFHGRPELADPLYKLICSGKGKLSCPNTAGALHPLGPGLAPSEMSLNYLLQGGSWNSNAHVSVFGPDEFGNAQLVLPGGSQVELADDDTDRTLGIGVTAQEGRDGSVGITFRVNPLLGALSPLRAVSVPAGGSPTNVPVPGLGTVRVDPAPVLRTVHVPIQVNFLLAYWFARAHQLLEP